MRALIATISELFGLFVDDGSLVVAILVLLGGVALLVHEAVIGGGLAAVLLFAGSLTMLIENVVRSARRKR